MRWIEHSIGKCRTFSPVFSTNFMKRNLLLLTVMMFALSSMLSAQEPTVKRPFNGTNFDGWQFRAGNRENVWTVGKLNPNATLEQAATTLEPMPQQQDAFQRQGVFQRRNVFQRQGTLQRQGTREGGAGFMINNVGADWRDASPPRGVDIYTAEKFGDCTVKVEFLILRRGNSGVYLMGEYEVQINDSFARPPDRSLGQGDMGAIYSAAAPTRNAAGAPGTWQSFEIEFVAPRFDAEGNKTANAMFKRVVLNGVLVQENVEVEGSTGGGLTGREAATGPLMFQGDHGPVAFRNIEIIIP